jgi:hypothetical protein
LPPCNSVGIWGPWTCLWGVFLKRSSLWIFLGKNLKPIFWKFLKNFFPQLSKKPQILNSVHMSGMLGSMYPWIYSILASFFTARKKWKPLPLPPIAPWLFIEMTQNFANN